MTRTMVVDDSRAMRMILGRALRDAGFEVLEASSGREALERLEQEGPSFRLVLVDWNMPGLTGLEFVEQVRRQPAWNGVRLLMVTTETGVDQITRALTAGADEYVMKPFAKEALTDKLRLLGLIE